tara:strand:- start:134 stop:520 length:387 start_codon:yes stop_codon:yes gene_type:complete
MQIWQDKEFRLIFYGGYISYILIGLIGIILVSDQFDAERLALCCGIVFPGITALSLIILQNPNPASKYPRLFWAIIIMTCLVVSWGHLLLINTIGPVNSQLMSRNNRAITMNIMEKKGSLGWIYKKRF